MNKVLVSIVTFSIAMLVLTAASFGQTSSTSTHTTPPVPSSGTNTQSTSYTIEDDGSPWVSGVAKKGGVTYSEVSNPQAINEYAITIIKWKDAETGKDMLTIGITFGKPQNAGDKFVVSTTRTGGATPSPSNESWI